MIRHLHDRFTIDDHSYICQPYSVNGSMASISVGKYCSIAANACFDVGFQHYYKAATTFPMHILKDGVPSNVWCRGGIEIGHDVWIGNNVTIMGGVTIGNGAIVGANTTVRRNIPPYEVCTNGEELHFYSKLRKYRFDKETITKLLEIAWWDWEESRILANAELLVDRDINKFINEHI